MLTKIYFLLGDKTYRVPHSFRYAFLLSTNTHDWSRHHRYIFSPWWVTQWCWCLHFRAAHFDCFTVASRRQAFTGSQSPLPVQMNPLISLIFLAIQQAKMMPKICKQQKPSPTPPMTMRCDLRNSSRLFQHPARYILEGWVLAPQPLDGDIQQESGTRLSLSVVCCHWENCQSL